MDEGISSDEPRFAASGGSKAPRHRTRTLSAVNDGSDKRGALGRATRAQTKAITGWRRPSVVRRGLRHSAPVSAPLSGARRRYLLTGAPTTIITDDPGGVDRVPTAHLRRLVTATKPTTNGVLCLCRRHYRVIGSYPKTFVPVCQLVPPQEDRRSQSSLTSCIHPKATDIRTSVDRESIYNSFTHSYCWISRLTKCRTPPSASSELPTKAVVLVNFAHSHAITALH
jgi:hypothetical protein